MINSKCAILPVTEGKPAPPNASPPVLGTESTESKSTSSKSLNQEVPPGEVQWQWLHRTGFRNYDKQASERIERAYQDGIPFVRLKSGKFGAVPMEVFFADMVQHDPISGNMRQVQRVGPNSFIPSIFRLSAKLLNNIGEGRLRQITVSEYRQKRENLASGEADPIAKLQSNKTLKRAAFREDAWCSKIALHPLFGALTFFVVIFNSIYIAIDADLHEDKSLLAKDAGFQLLEHLFCGFFLFELAIRFGASKKKKDCLRDGWFILDSLLLLLMIGETWILTIVLKMNGGPEEGGGAPFGGLGVLRMARLLRLARLGRVAKILRLFPEIVTMLKGLFEATRSVFFTVLLLILLLFVFGIIFKIQASDKPGVREIFPTVSQSMWVLLVRGTMLDSPSNYFEKVEQLEQPAPELVALMVLFIFLSSFTVLNMLIGVLCDVVRHVSDIEKDKLAVADMKASLLTLLECFDKDDDRMIAKNEFDMVMKNPEMNQVLRRYRVDPVDLISIRDIIFDEADHFKPDSVPSGTESDAIKPREKKLSFFEFMEVVLRLRGGNSASVMDIIDLRNYIRQRLDKFESPADTAPVAEPVSPKSLAAAGHASPSEDPFRSPHSVSSRAPGTQKDSEVLYTHLIKRQEAFEEEMKSWRESQEQAQQKLGEDVKLIGLQLQTLLETMSTSTLTKEQVTVDDLIRESTLNSIG